MKFIPRVSRYIRSSEVEPVLMQGTFSINSVGIALRCEICHQSDLFDEATGLCSRCNHVTS
ncbi:MAG: hypothetical protein NZ558_10670 [Blastocatellia bacterium]|nr:hypothetical protein [Blastocatellia bacterium]